MLSHGGLKVIFQLNCPKGSASIHGQDTLHHGGALRVIRASGNQLESLSLRLTEAVANMTWDDAALNASLPPDASVVSVHCFTQRVPSVGNRPPLALPLIGLTMMQGREDHLAAATFALRVYGGDAPGDSSPEDLVQWYQHLELDYVPSCITSVVVPDAASKGLLPGAFLLSGSKRDIHVYVQHMHTRQFALAPDALQWCTALPPAFARLRTQVLCVTMLHRTERGPIVAFGCEDGSVLLSVNHVERQRAQLDGPVSCVALFSSGVARVGRSARQELWADRPPLVHWKVAADSRDTDWGSVSQRVQRGTQAASAALSALRANVAAAASAAPSATKEVCLCVGGAVGFGAVFDDVDTNGLDVCCTLPSSHEHDSVLSAATGDFLALGSTQVVLGTYGGSILVYSRAQQRPTDWELTFVLSFGPPVSALAVLRQIDVVPHLLVSSSSTFAVVAMRVSDLERLLQSRLEDAAKKYFEAETK